MRIEGRIIPPKGKEKLWGVEIDSIGVFTQGKSLRNAYLMAKDAVELLAEDAGIPFEATIEPGSEKHTFTLGCDDARSFLQFTLRRIRESNDLSLMEVSEKLDSNSPNAYSRYEHGTMPRLDTLEEMLGVIDPDLDLVFKKRA
mgnify:CR=1 FL=1